MGLPRSVSGFGDEFHEQVERAYGTELRRVLERRDIDVELARCRRRLELIRWPAVLDGRRRRN